MIYLHEIRQEKQIDNLFAKEKNVFQVQFILCPYLLDGCFDLVHGMAMYFRLFSSHVVVLLSILQYLLNLICATVLFLKRFCIFAVFKKISKFLICRD